MIISNVMIRIPKSNGMILMEKSLVMTTIQEIKNMDLSLMMYKVF
jgi:hypothetical protein